MLSLHSNPATSINRTSAGTASPSVKRMMSPGTSVATSRVMNFPSRSTTALCRMRECRAAAACSARYSLTNPRPMLAASCDRTCSSIDRQRRRDHRRGGPGGVPEGRHHPGHHAEGTRRGAAAFPGQSGVVVEIRRDLHRTETVGQRMIELAQQCAASVAQSFDKRCLPKRPVPVIAGHQCGSGELEEIRLGADPRLGHSVQMESRSKSRSTSQCGGHGGVDCTTFCRKRGTARLIRSNRSTMTSHSIRGAARTR